jgi:pSer/pThr/pTyr-binding forkhead associated (FHA) protein/anti-anti-sigma regulatory factor
MKFFLIVAKGKKQGMPIPIEVDLFTIGSGKACQLRAVHEKIGEQHCALVLRGRKVFIRDLNADEATIVNGEVIPPSQEWPLHAGDVIEIGPLKFVIQYHEKELSKRDLEEWALKCLDLDGSRRVTAIDRIEAVTAEAKQMDNAADVASTILERLSIQRGIVKGRLRISREEGITVVRINDIYLVEEAELMLIKKELHDNLNRPNLKVLLDMKNVRRMSSNAVEMLAEVIAWLRPFGSRIAITRLKSELQEMLMNFPSSAGMKFIPDKKIAMQGKW